MEAKPPTEIEGASGQVRLVLASETGLADFAMLPTDVTATVTITATAGTLPITATVFFEILNPATGKWTVLKGIPGINIAALLTPLSFNQLFTPADIQTAIGISAGTFQMRVNLGLQNIVGNSVPITTTPVSFTLGQLPTGTVTITVA